MTSYGGREGKNGAFLLSWIVKFWFAVKEHTFWG